MNTGKHAFLLLATATAILMCGSRSRGEPQSTAPIGYISWELQSGSTALFGVPLYETPLFEGKVLSVTGDSIRVTGLPWIAGQFSNAGAAVHFLSGVQEGRFLKVLSNTENSATLQTGGRTLTESGFSVVSGDRFEILPVDTLETLFGASPADLVLQGGTTPAAADLVAVFTNGEWVQYFFQTGGAAPRWERTDQPGIAQNPVAILPSSPIRITRRGPAKQVFLAGRVPVSRGLLPIAGEITPLAWPFPVDRRLEELSVSGPAPWLKNNLAEQADWVALTGQGGTFFQVSTGAWNAVPGSSSPAAAGAALETGSGFYIAKSNPPATLAFHSVAVPYLDGDLEPTPTPTPAPRPTPVPTKPPQALHLAPTIKLLTKRKFTTSSESTTIRGRASGHGAPLAKVEYKEGSKYRRTRGASRWRFKANLKPGRNIFYIRAVDRLGKKSRLKKVIVVRKDN